MPGTTYSLPDSLIACGSVWSVLALAALVGDPWQAEVGFLAATVLVLALRGRRRVRVVAGATALALAAGYASLPAWIALIWLLGSGVGLPAASVGSPAPGHVATWIAVVALAPLFEELLYRERLLSALRGALGSVPAVVVSSALFAVPHLEPWALLGTFVVGLGLGALLLASDNAWICVAFHAGLNVGILVCGVPAVERALPPDLALLAGLALVLAALTHLARSGGGGAAWLRAAATGAGSHDAGRPA